MQTSSFRRRLGSLSDTHISHCSCTHCDGTGTISRDECPLCEGMGYLSSTHFLAQLEPAALLPTAKIATLPHAESKQPSLRQAA